MWSTSCPSSSSVSNSDYLRKHARRLLCAALLDGDTSASLPVLRRLLATLATKVERLADLNASREALQLKHLLAMLAVELGYAHWDACKQESTRSRQRARRLHRAIRRAGHDDPEKASRLNQLDFLPVRVEEEAAKLARHLVELAHFRR